jgi:hypothetical protein
MGVRCWDRPACSPSWSALDRAPNRPQLYSNGTPARFRGTIPTFPMSKLAPLGSPPVRGAHFCAWIEVDSVDDDAKVHRQEKTARSGYSGSFTLAPRY